MLRGVNVNVCQCMSVGDQTWMWVQFDIKEGRTNSIFILNQSRKRIRNMHPLVFNLCVVSSRCRMDYGSEINLEYVELGGIVGVFVKLDAALIDEHSLENLLHSTQHQVLLLVSVIVLVLVIAGKVRVESFPLFWKTIVPFWNDEEKTKTKVV